MNKTISAEARARLAERSRLRYHGLPIEDRRVRQHNPQVLARAREIAAEWALVVLPAVRKHAWRTVRYWHWLDWPSRLDFVQECCGVAWVQTLSILATGKHNPLDKAALIAWSSVKRVKSGYGVTGYESAQDAMSRRARMLRSFKTKVLASLDFDDWLSKDWAA
jgi:hypothetical protein